MCESLISIYLFKYIYAKQLNELYICKDLCLHACTKIIYNIKECKAFNIFFLLKWLSLANRNPILDIKKSINRLEEIEFNSPKWKCLKNDAKACQNFIDQFFSSPWICTFTVSRFLLYCHVSDIKVVVTVMKETIWMEKFTLWFPWYFRNSSKSLATVIFKEKEKN